MSIIVVCPACHQSLQAPDELAGQAARCACGVILSVPFVPATSSLLNELSPSDYRAAAGQNSPFKADGTATEYVPKTMGSDQPLIGELVRWRTLTAMPGSVKSVCFALGWNCGLAMVVIATACIGVMLFPYELEWKLGWAITGFVLVMFLVSCGNLWALSLIQQGRNSGRVLALLMILPNLSAAIAGGLITLSAQLGLMSNIAGVFLVLAVPCSIIGALVTLLGLFTGEANEYFRRRRW